jgi:four helix bundle protein
MAAIESYRDLLVSQRAIETSVAFYKMTASFPKDELFGLTSQMRRAGVSTASNIADGYGRNSSGEYKHFLGIARGSNLELQTRLLIATQLGFSTGEALAKVDSLSNEVSKMLNSLLAKL